MEQIYVDCRIKFINGRIENIKITREVELDSKGFLKFTFIV